MSNATKVESSTPVVPMLRSDLVSVLLLGGGVGLLIWLAGLLLHTYVFDAYFCQGDSTSQCGGAKNYAAIAAGVVGAIVALGGLVRLRVYRPLLVVIAVLVSTWGIAQMSWGFGWFTGALVMIVLYALATGLFSWVSRIREFWIALVVMILLTVAVRLALTV